MAIVDTMINLKNEEGLSQKDIADLLHVHPSYVSKLISGDRKPPESLDASFAKMNWRMAIAVIDERTGGWIRNRFGELDPHPASIKEQLMKELQEAYDALGEIMMGNHIDREKQRENAAKVQKEIRDVVEVGMVMYGVIGEVFGLEGNSATSTKRDKNVGQA